MVRLVLPDQDRTPRPARKPIPAWMRDRATLVAIRRQRLIDAGIEPLSPGTRRLARVIDQAFSDLEERLREQRADEAPF